MVLNLDPSFTPLGTTGAIAFQSFVFSGGEPHIKITTPINPDDTITVTHRINSFNDLGLLCMAVDALGRMGARKIQLFIPYFPAARQDRLMVKGEPLSVKVYAGIINNLDAEKVFVFDPHSDVTPAVVDNCEVISNHAFIKEVSTHIKKGFKLVSPDAGASKKIYGVSQHLGGIEVIECSKNRDVKTGAINGCRVYTDDLQGADCLIVDDICDGGNTFIMLAKELKSKNAGKLYLAVSHGIFSKGLNELAVYFAGIFTTNSIGEIKHTGLLQIPISY